MTVPRALIRSVVVTMQQKLIAQVRKQLPVALSIEIGGNKIEIYSGIERCPGNETVRLRELDRNMGSNVGRLEICYNGYWQSVCKHNATGPTSAIVACRELGYSNLLKG